MCAAEAGNKSLRSMRIGPRATRHIWNGLHRGWCSGRRRSVPTPRKYSRGSWRTSRTRRWGIADVWGSFVWPTSTLLRAARRLHGMADSLKTQQQDPAARELSFLDRLAMLIDPQWNWRQNQALARRLHTAKLRGNACVEEVDYRAARGLDKSVIRALAQESGWVRNHEHVFILGPTGVGKSFLACALAQKACRDGYSALYTRTAALFRDLGMARADGSLRLLLTKLSRIDVLVIDDWAMAPLTETERRDFWEICEDRYQTRSMILTSQLPVARWHEQIGDPTVADGILDRLVHNAHRIEMKGDSMRKKRCAGGGA